MANRNINGVDVEQLFSTINAIKENPGLAKFEFRANNQWVNGGHNRTSIKDFYGAGREDLGDVPELDRRRRIDVSCGPGDAIGARRARRRWIDRSGRGHDAHGPETASRSRARRISLSRVRS